ncbi:MAG: universal stress protein [Bacteroidetes bacterium]|nr:universal stress protein [Bacteroidota bacterium]MDA0943152.1 universal stress protein [Bacteroidota bacterium]MDA1111247.1 universal stress protein [Bacteroidota bacterium]
MERKTNNSILVPTDFSEVADRAVEHSVLVAKAYGNDITLLYVLEEGLFSGLFAGSQSAMIEDAMKIKLDQQAKELSERCNITINTRVAKGSVYKTIAQIANAESFDSIIMGSHGASGFEQVIGSNSSRTIQYAEVPVVVVKNSSMGKDGYKKIVMPIDLTLESKQKVDWAIHLSKTFDSEIHVVYTESDDPYLKVKISANIKQVENRLKEHNIKFEIYKFEDSIMDNFATEVLNYGNIVNADLILVMTHTEKGISEMIIGTLTQQLVNRSVKVPVMCIHPQEIGYLFDY